MVEALRSPTRLMNSRPSVVLGSTEPRLWTPPLRPLTPDTSYGFDLIDFARDACRITFDPWEDWLSIHAGELLPDGRPRFRELLILVARQNGKTTWSKVLVHYWMHIDGAPLTLITSTDRSYAKRTWSEVVEEARSNKWLARRIAELRLSTSEEALKLKSGAELVFKANNGNAGRSMVLRNWLCDEVREHTNHDAWDSATNAMNAVDDAQAVAISNQGGANAVVLDRLRDPALQFIETGEGDPQLGLFEWSAPPGSEPDDVEGLRASNPNLNRVVRGTRHGPNLEDLLRKGRRAKRAGGEELSGFRTEVLCQRVTLLDPAIDPDLWLAAKADEPVDWTKHRGRVALCLDVSMSEDHASLIAATESDGTVYVGVAAAWSGFGCLKEVRADLPAFVAKVKPRALGWFPSGPAAAIAADIAKKKAWPRGVRIEALTTETTAACMGLAALVRVGDVLHPGDPMLDAHIDSAQRLRRGDGWVFTRRNAGPVDGAYALAGAVHLARTLPPPLAPLSAA